MILLEDLDDVALLVGHHCLLSCRILGASQPLPWGAVQRTRGVRAETVRSGNASARAEARGVPATSTRCSSSPRRNGIRPARPLPGSGLGGAAARGRPATRPLAAALAVALLGGAGRRCSPSWRT